MSFLLVLAAATTFYVRADGGSPTQCSGTADAPYPGTGVAQPCAWDHPFRALPPHGAPLLGAGDTLRIRAGSYMMGAGAPGADRCDASASWDCVMPPVPSGPSASAPTRIIGDCAQRPELWGSGRAEVVVNLNGSSNVEVRCLEITDHSSCVEFHSGGLACNRDTPPFGPWAAIGLEASDSSNVLLQDLDIHGLASTGVHAGRLTDWTVENVRIAANGSAGWDGDIGGDDSNSGTMRFHRWVVEWNGCGETWPGRAPTGCWAQEAGGYGDGVGTGETQGHWIIEESSFLNNTSDGLDLLYARPGSSIEIRRTLARGNAGNQIKTNGPVVIENSIIVGNCGFHQGKPFTFNVDPCRALGTALSINLFRGDRATVVNNTITSEGDCIVVGECSGVCDGSERLTLRNNLLVGQTDYLQPFEQSCAMYQETFPRDPFDAAFNLIVAAKENDCPGTNEICGVDPALVSRALDSFDAHLTGASPAIDRGSPTDAPAVDFDGLPRDARPDIGAYELRATPPRRRAVRH